jgi:hypothetical protein
MVEISEGALSELVRALRNAKERRTLADVMRASGVRLRRGEAGFATANCPSPSTA